MGSLLVRVLCPLPEGSRLALWFDEPLACLPLGSQLCGLLWEELHLCNYNVVSSMT